MRITIQIDDATTPSAAGPPVSVSMSGQDGAGAEAPPLDAGPAPIELGDDERTASRSASAPAVVGAAESAGAAPSFTDDQ